MPILYIDTETFSSIPIKYGMYKYMEQVELLMISYALDTNDVQVWDTINTVMPADLKHFLTCDNLMFCAHNSAFDHMVLQHCLQVNHILWCDTAAMARRHSLPAGLGDLCTVFHISEDNAKMKEGRQLINLFCKPQSINRKTQRATHLTHPDRWQLFLDYAKMDISAMREIYKRIPVWNNSDTEDALYTLDRKINTRGFRIDTLLAEKAIAILTVAKEDNDREMTTITAGQVRTANQRDVLLAYILSEYGVSLPDLQSSTLKRRVDDPDLPEEVKELIKLRLLSAKSSTRKYQTVMSCLSQDSRLRGTLMYCGADRTGRWSGRLFQPHNLPRPLYDQSMVDIGALALKKDCLPLFFDKKEVPSVTSSVVRSLIIPKDKHKLVVSDYASIEGRVLAWSAGEAWKIEAYEQYDKGIGYDIYTLTYANVFGVAPDSVTKKQRPLGKVLELALGYAGGVGAFIVFAKAYNIDLEDLANARIPVDLIREARHLYDYLMEEGKEPAVSREVFISCDGIKRMWRRANPKTENYWQDLNCAVRTACDHSDDFPIGNIIIDKKGAWLRVKLPSGRYLCYPGIRIVDGDITYMGKCQYTRSWTRLKTYGGKLAENITQAIARDILAQGMLRAEENNYRIVLTVHDEVVTEVPDTADYGHLQLSNVITQTNKWMTGLPLAASGYDSYRYQK